MASGLPCICADATGSNALLDDGTTGFLAPAGDVAAFLEPAERLVRDAGLRRTIGARAHAAAQAYDWDAILAHLSTHYTDVLAPAERGV
jgi:glycosyltransferase involved in cell wall biosynthesis